MKIKIILIGKPALWIQSAVEHWLNRIIHFAQIELMQLKSINDKKGFDRLINKRSDKSIALTRKGRILGSIQWAKLLERIMLDSKDAVFVIGDANGLPEKVINSCDDKISFGKITIQHDIALLVLIEQIFRGLSIINGLPYHRGVNIRLD